MTKLLSIVIIFIVLSTSFVFARQYSDTAQVQITIHYYQANDIEGLQRDLEELRVKYPFISSIKLMEVME